MKKLMTMMLGLSLMFCGVAAFAQDQPAATKPADTTTQKPKKVKKAKVKKTKKSKTTEGGDTATTPQK